MPLKLMSGTIVSVRRLGKIVQLKDIETRNGNFIANGVVVSNCHHAAAETYATCMGSINATHKFGCTATPYRTDRLDRIFLDHVGGITFKMKDMSLTPRIEVMKTNLGLDMRSCYTRTGEPHLTKMINMLVKTPAYNQMLLDRILHRLGEGRKVLMLSHRVDHCRYMVDEVKKYSYSADFIVGSYKVDGKTKSMSIAQREAKYFGNDFLSGTYGCMAEGIDIPPLESLIIGTPFGAPGMAAQSVGRVQRDFPDKKEPSVDDFWLTDHRMLDSLARKRIRTYRSEKWPVMIIGSAPAPEEDEYKDTYGYED